MLITTETCADRKDFRWWQGKFGPSEGPAAHAALACRLHVVLRAPQSTLWRAERLHKPRLHALLAEAGAYMEAGKDVERPSSPLPHVMDEMLEPISLHGPLQACSMPRVNYG